MYASPTCSAPEAMLGGPISRAYDIWSLGCVFLEFITWLFEGNRGFYIFVQRRTDLRNHNFENLFENLDGIANDCFYTSKYLDSERSPACVEMNSSVTAWIKCLHQDPRCSGMVDEILDLISHRMLRVQPGERIRPDELASQLGRILERNSEYLLGTNPPEEDIGAEIKKPQEKSRH
jgi:serine/threonine protein kinase